MINIYFKIKKSHHIVTIFRLTSNFTVKFLHFFGKVMKCDKHKLIWSHDVCAFLTKTIHIKVIKVSKIKGGARSGVAQSTCQKSFVVVWSWHGFVVHENRWQIMLASNFQTKKNTFSCVECKWRFAANFCEYSHCVYKLIYMLYTSQSQKVSEEPHSDNSGLFSAPNSILYYASPKARWSLSVRFCCCCRKTWPKFANAVAMRRFVWNSYLLEFFLQKCWVTMMQSS